jgi:NDP-sugar pyrophosphorylase family protein
VASPALLGRIEERGRFGIFEPYLRLAAEGERILPYRADGAVWIDVGRPETLARAREMFGGRPRN